MRCLSEFVTIALLLAVGAAASAVNADETAPTAAEASLAERLKANPDDVPLVREFLGDSLKAAMDFLPADPAAAEKRLAETKSVLAELAPKTPAAVHEIARAKHAIWVYSRQVALARITFGELERSLVANPDDTDAFRMYFGKLTMEINVVSRSNTSAADEKLQSAREFLTSVREKMTTDAARKQFEYSRKGLERLKSTIAAAKKRDALVGKDAMPLDVETWLNGSLLSDADLKGKVIVLDFWAVWCSPCRAMFPNLRKWQDKWEDQGLVIIGITQYYNFDWDDATERVIRSARTTTHESEREMLVKFARKHDLRHRIAIQNRTSGMPSFYGVSGVPHYVVIDRQGKVRMVRAGNSEQNAKDIGDLLEELVANTK